MHPSAKSAPSTAKASAPVDKRVEWLGLWTTPTAVECTVVVGAPAVDVVDVGAVAVGAAVAGAAVVGVVLGATVPGWAPLADVAVAGATGVVAAGVVAAGVVAAGVVTAGAGELEVVLPCTRADPGIGIPKARSVLPVVLAAEAKAGLTAKQHAASPQKARARAQVKP
jgi:hypothetical protein